jgi:geranylgeranyl diphosphate synthase type I
MNFTSKLLAIKKKVDFELALQFNRAIIKVKKSDAFLAEALLHSKNITLSGGKRLRPALVFCAAEASGSKDEKKIIKIATAIELVHCFLLIHDDIIDDGDFRHGVPTINNKYEKIGEKKFKNKNCKHFGNSMAIILGDLVFSMAIEVILQSKIEKDRMLEIISYLQKVIQNTIIGQSQDLLIECKKDVSKKEVLSMYENKTAKYSFEAPLQIGLMINSNIDKKLQNMFSDFAISVGIAFQMQDDIIGIFGQAKKTGKSVVTDIEQGKKTMLVLETLERLKKEDKKIFTNILEKRNVTKQDILIFRKMIKESGALDFLERNVQENLLKGKTILEKSSLKKETKDFLLGLVTYLEERKY